jgi:hypothetical protein
MLMTQGMKNMLTDHSRSLKNNYQLAKLQYWETTAVTYTG